MPINYQQWTEDVQRVDEMIHTRLEENHFSCFLPTLSGRNYPNFMAFQEHLMYVIISFLNEENSADNRPKELFIQLPIEEFAVAGRDQDNNFRRLVGTAEACLQLCSVGSYYDCINVTPEMVEQGLDDWSNNGEYFVGFNTDGGVHLLRRCGRRFQRYYPVNRRWFDTNPQMFFGQNIFNRIIRVTNGIRPNDLNRVEAAFARLGQYVEASGDVIRQYQKAFLIRRDMYNSLNDNLIDETCFGIGVVERRNTIPNVQNVGDDAVVVLVGDAAYNRQHRRCVNLGFKKIIYIGSERPGEQIPTYPFTFREMCRYCSLNGNQRFDYQLPEFVENIQFPWLDNAIEGFKRVLEGVNPQFENGGNKALRLFSSFCSHLDFGSARWQDKWPSVKDSILNCFDYTTTIENYDAFAEGYDKIEAYLDSLVYEEESNPKKSQAEEITRRADNRTRTLVLSRSSSYKRAINRLASDRNIVVIDRAANVPSIDAAWSSAYRWVARYRPYATTVYALYYTHEASYANSLRDFLNSEESCYTKELRCRYGTQMCFGGDNVGEAVAAPVLEDFMSEPEFEGDYDSRWYSGVKYQVTFEDGSQTIIDGDVLMHDDEGWRRIGVEELQQGVTIRYYQPGDFEMWMNYYFGEAEVQRVDESTRDWKEALRRYCDNNPERVRQIALCAGTNAGVIRNHLRPNGPDFLQQMAKQRRACEFLERQGLLTSEQSRFILACKRIRNASTKYGRKFKDELMTYFLEDNVGDILSIICKNSENTPEDVFEECMPSGKVNNIRIVN